MIRTSLCTLLLLTSLTACQSVQPTPTLPPHAPDHAPAPAHAATRPPTAVHALAALMQGNQRFVQGRLQHGHQTPDRRLQVASGQKPFAIVLTCADSRVPPEVLFDQGVGDLFVVRVAGNIADDAVLGSIEYAAEHLGAPLVVVMGHSKCGAVQATADAVASHTIPPGHLPALVDPIKPAVLAQKAGPDLVDRAIDANTLNTVQRIEASPMLAHLIHAGKLTVIGGRYDLVTGKFTLLGLPDE